jgi:hypothetical protein
MLTFWSLCLKAKQPPSGDRNARTALRGLRMPKDVLVETRAEVDRVKAHLTSLENLILTRGRRIYG